MARLQELVTLLEHVTAHPSQLPGAIQQFQTTVWNSTDQQLGGTTVARDVLRTLAHDLEYYVADPEARAEDPVYCGEDRALQTIRAALNMLAGEGAA